jgi:murein DD-endopeptidase MepM/ murein hydrolase activator NlpD
MLTQLKQYDEEELESIYSKGSLFSDNKQIKEISNVVTQQRNALTAIVTYNNNILKIADSVKLGSNLNKKEKILESSNNLISNDNDNNQVISNNLISSLQNLTTLIDELGEKLKMTDLSSTKSVNIAKGMDSSGMKLGSTGKALAVAGIAIAGISILSKPKPPRVDQASEKLSKTATSAVKSAESRSESIKISENSFSNQFASFIGNMVKTGLIGGVVGAIGGAIGSMLGGSTEDGPGSYAEANLSGVKGDWAKDKPFIDEVNRVSKKFNIDSGDLLGLMWSESRMNPAAKNPKGSASGLIQFIESTAKGLGTTTSDIRKMTRVQQMPLVEKYLDSVGLPKGASAGQLYTAVFLPAYVKKPANFVLAESGSKIYNLNKGLDVDNNGQITIDDLSRTISKKRQEIGLGASTVPSQNNDQTKKESSSSKNLGTSEAPKGTIWKGKDEKDGLMTFVSKTNDPSTGKVKYETWTSADSTHYPINEEQANTQIQSRKLKSNNTTTQKTSAPQKDVQRTSDNPGLAITSKYGYRRDPITGQIKFHAGNDIKVASGTPLYSTMQGTVKFAGQKGGYGNIIEILYSNGAYAKFAHLSSIGVSVGQSVSAGQFIGKSGNTGRSTGAHLHFEIRKGGPRGQVLDPSGYGNPLNGKPGQAAAQQASAPKSQGLPNASTQVAIQNAKQKQMAPTIIAKNNIIRQQVKSPIVLSQASGKTNHVRKPMEHFAYLVG